MKVIPNLNANFKYSKDLGSNKNVNWGSQFKFELFQSLLCSDYFCVSSLMEFYLSMDNKAHFRSTIFYFLF